MGRVGFAGLWGTSLRCCVGSRLGETIEHMCLYCQGRGVTLGEGEEKTEACTCAKTQVHASSLVLGERGWRWIAGM